MEINQSIQKIKEKVWVGMTAVYYEPYKRNLVDTAKQGSITKVGNKYIYVNTLKFDKETMSSDLPHCRLYIGTLDEFIEAVNLQKSITALLSDCLKEVNIERPLPFLRDIEQQLTSIITQMNTDDGQ